MQIEWKAPYFSAGMVTLCHGYQSSRNNSTIVAITKGLNQLGYDTFAFSFSTNTGGFDIEHQVNDIRQIIDYFIGYKEIILLASSFGALTAAIATVKFPKVKGLITLNGFFGGWRLGKDYCREYTKFRIAALVTPTYRKIWQYFKKELRPERIVVPVLVVHSKVDKSVSPKQSQDFFNRLKVSKRFMELQTANHGITLASDREIVISEIDNWVRTKRDD